ncbi:sigma-70 family RNA polymerase sigma factor [Lignipirellula cremea]|uniref:RNA polymerase sigma factor n=1 Tax=Lignipirellula cremea TaxID=2528010 RepID=A0A518E316_9BACT|nr:sigma-70 family RNA polymerase sigma factor [Lignipirellula cremea]QDU98462.1 ECF RNA polymerase sigma factor SigW [Lignipirellula cremea]
MNDDLQLIDESLAGDTEAFGRLVQKHQDRLFNTLCHVVGCREEAEDIAQEAFVQAFVKLETFRRDSAFYTWLYRIAFNLAVSHGRRNRRRTASSLDQSREATGDEPTDPQEGPEQSLERQERAELVQAALQAISSEYRMILVLREMENNSYEVISEILGVPIGTVRSRLHRARLQLRDELKETLQINE